MAYKKKLTFKDIINSDKPVLVDFFATWCGPCKALAPIIGEVKAELGDSMRVIKIDVDKKKSIAGKYKVRSMPTLAIFKNGEIVWRASGMKTKQELLKVCEEFIDGGAPVSDERVESGAKKRGWFGRLFGG